MALNQDFFMGFVSGTVVGAVGYRLYEQNGSQLNRLVQSSYSSLTPQANMSQPGIEHGHQPTTEDLVAQKERLEDLIAERELDNK